MNNQVIVVDDNEIADEDVWGIFNNKCNDALSSEEKFVAVYLKSELGTGVPLLNWLETWQARFQKEGKSFFVISEDKQQIESMELSGPEQDLNYFTSVNEFEDHIKFSPAGSEEKEVVISEEEIEKKQEKDDYSYPTFKDGPQTISLAVGDTVEIAGEYTCQSCGIGRMWMKGKEVAACKNPECFEPSKGWKLDFDLF